MSKAGKGDGVDAGAVGSQHPVPENIPHLSSPVNGSGASVPKHHGSVPGIQAGSPIKESSFLKSETSAEETQGDNADKPQDTDAIAPEPVAAGGEGIPIRR